MIAWQLFTIDEPGKLYDANALYLNVLRNVLIRLVQADWCSPVDRPNSLRDVPQSRRAACKMQSLTGYKGWLSDLTGPRKSPRDIAPLDPPLAHPRPQRRRLHRCPSHRRHRPHNLRKLSAPPTPLHQIRRIMKINELTTITADVVETARGTLVIGAM